MSERRKETTDSDRGSSRHHRLAAARVDAPHVVSNKGAATTSPVPARADAMSATRVGAGVSVESTGSHSHESLDVHAQQLARQLQERQQSLDRREAQLNAMHADLDSRYRMARLWLTEQETHIAEKTASLDEKEREIAEYGSRAAVAQAAQAESSREEQSKLDQTAKDIERREEEQKADAQRLAEQEQRIERAKAELEERRRQQEDRQRWDQQRYLARRAAFLELVRLQNAGIERRRRAVEEDAARLASEGNRKSNPHCATDEGLSARQRRLVQAEAALEGERLELFECRQKQAAEREALFCRATALRQKLDESRRRAAARIARENALLTRRRKEISGQKRALDETRREVVRIHRETLELRLAIEEIWTQLGTSASPEVLTESLGKARHKLADQYRLAREELATREAELEKIREQLAGEHKELIGRKNELQDWLARRQNELDEQRAALARRQQALEAHEDEQSERWTEAYGRRLALEREVRRLRIAVGRGTRAA